MATPNAETSRSLASPTGMSVEEQTKKIADAVFIESVEMPEDAPTVQGFDFNKGLDYDALFQSFQTMGFQATNLALAIDRVNEMIDWKGEPEEGETEIPRCKIFLGYTSNMISCGVREVIRFLVQHNMVSCIVTTGGGIEEDFMKCYNPHYMGDFHLKGETLRKQGLNRIGNLIVPNKNYCDFEDFMTPILDEMLHAQREEKKIWSPASMIKLLGERINNPESVYYWAAKNDIPVFCPAITDGSVGDMLYFHSIKNSEEPLIMDIAQDIKGINDIAMYAKRTGMLIVGGGLVKHHICNANLMRNGADYSVYLNTGIEHEGSDAGAPPDEAVSWGKIKMTAKPVKVWGEASINFPLLVSQTFVKAHFAKQTNQAEAAPETTDS